MKKIQIFIALFISILVFSCQKSQNEVVPKKNFNKSLRVQDAFADPTYYSIYYGDHPTLTVNQYVKRARKNGTIGVFGFGNTLISDILNWNSATHSAIQNSNRNDLVTDLTKIGFIPSSVPYSGKAAVVFRGGSSFAPTTNDYKINPANGLVRTDFGVSLDLNVNANSYLQNGAYKISYFPSGLSIIQRGNSPTHYEIVPTQEMTLSNYTLKLSQIVGQASF